MRFTVLAGLVVGSLLAAPMASAQENFVIHPEWTQTPNRDDMRRFYPQLARGETGEVRALCLIDEKGRFSSCEITSETPSGKGFAESTIKLSKLFRMKLKDGDGAAVAGRKLHLPVTWSGSLAN